MRPQDHPRKLARSKRNGDAAAHAGTMPQGPGKYIGEWLIQRNGQTYVAV